MEAMQIREIVSAVNGTLLYGEEEISIRSVSTNSKEFTVDGLFVPIIGERVDAHLFIDGALENGCVACFTSKAVGKYVSGKAYIKVEDTMVALQKLASYYRAKFQIPVIGITGSVGKTTTKEMIATALEAKYRVLRTTGNMNSQVGVPLMMFQLNSDHEIAVIEMGMSEVGEMEKLARIVRPDVAVMTNIGVSHIAQLKTQENIRREKLHITDTFGTDGILFVNGNDRLLKEIYTANSSKENNEELLINGMVCTYGTEDSCDYLAKDLMNVGEETKFQFQSEKHREQVTLGVLGEHNVFNAVVALAIAEHFAVPMEDAIQALYRYRPIAMRGQIEEVYGIKVIDDTYNASPDSMKSGVSMLVELPVENRRFAVLADVLELGEHSRECHYAVGTYISTKKVDVVVTIGKESKAIADAICDRQGSMKVVSFDDNDGAIAYLLGNLKAGDAVLIKGSRGMHTEEIVNAIKK